MAVEPFTWTDGERLIRFARGAIGEAPDLLAARGFERYALLTTERAAALSEALVGGAEVVLHVPPGPVPDAAAAVREGVDGHPLVALGGGRVVDAAKAIAAVEGLACAAVPTTLAGSPLTAAHRLPAGAQAARTVRPSLVAWDPDMLATLQRSQLAATGLNALAHAFEALYGPRANPVVELAALRAAELLGAQLPADPPDLDDVALGALLGGYAIGATGFAVHHALCQTAVRHAGLPHAETNALVLPHTAAFMAARAPEVVGRFADALDDPDGCGAGEVRERVGGRGPRPAGERAHDGADAVRARVGRLAAVTGVGGLSGLGLSPDAVADVAAAATGHPALPNTPGGAPTAADLAALLHAAL